MRVPQKSTEWVKLLCSMFVPHPKVCIDATAGNGNDTLFLKQLGADIVFCFDIQERALMVTRTLLEAHKATEGVHLVHACHSTLEAVVGDCAGTIDIVMFNLGYLPGGDKTIKTEATSTAQALLQATRVLRSGGVCFVVSYHGHPGAEQEYQSIENTIAGLDQGQYTAARISFCNQRGLPPNLAMIQRI